MQPTTGTHSPADRQRIMEQLTADDSHHEVDYRVRDNYRAMELGRLNDALETAQLGNPLTPAVRLAVRAALIAAWNALNTMGNPYGNLDPGSFHNPHLRAEVEQFSLLQAVARDRFGVTV